MGDLTLYQTLGRKIGVTDRKILRKAAELKNLLAVRASGISVAALRLTETANIVLCLDIAGRLLSQPVDKMEAIKLSGVKKTAYQVALKTLESVLDLNTKVSMRDMAVQFGCLQLLDAAVRVLSRREKVRIDQSRLREVAGVKRSTMDRLIAQMDNIATKLQEEGAQKKSGQKKKRSLMDDIETAVNGSPSGSSEATEPKRTKMEKDIDYYKNVDFEEWKRKLLEKASLDTQNCQA